VEAKLIDQPATWLGHPATTSRVAASAKSLELPYGPINTPLPVKIEHKPHFRGSSCIALILSVVARHSLVGRVAWLEHESYARIRSGSTEFPELLSVECGSSAEIL
jgi:hypothetical protein